LYGASFGSEGAEELARSDLSLVAPIERFKFARSKEKL